MSSIRTIDDPVYPWPGGEGIWMGWIEEMKHWFPLRVKELKDDLQGPDFGKPIAIVAQFPVSPDSWPYLFRGNHPVTQWRRPTEQELAKAKTFYGLLT